MYKDIYRKDSSCNEQGFSLLELMVVILIVAIGAAMAIPSLSGWSESKNLDSITRQIFSDIQRARSEAITRGRTITIQFNRGTGSWYEIHDSAGSIIPQTSIPSNIIIASTSFATVDTTGIDSRGFATKAGTITIHSNHVSTSTSLLADRKITLSIGGVVRIE